MSAPRTAVLAHRCHGGKDPFSAMVRASIAFEMLNHEITLFLTCFREEIMFLEGRIDKWRQRNPLTNAAVQTIY